MNCVNISVQDIANTVNGVILGDNSILVKRFCLNSESDEYSLTYFRKGSSLSKIKSCKFAAAIVEALESIVDDRTYIFINKDIYYVLHLLTELFINSGILRLENVNNNIHKNIICGKNVSFGIGVNIDEGSIIGNNVYIGNGVVIGRGCNIFPNVTILDRVVIGNFVTIQSGSVIGSNSFEYAENDGYHHIKNIGTVIIDDNVEIGANTTIDRGTIGNTYIGERTVVDNQVHIGHEVNIGKNCKICSQCGIAGWSTLKNNVILYGQTGVANNIIIEDNAVILAKSGISKAVKRNSVVFGIPAREKSEYLKEKAFLRKIYRKGRRQAYDR